MKKTVLSLMLYLSCTCIGLYAETNIPLTDLYGIIPLDNKDDDPIIIDRDGNGIAATIDGRDLTVKVPVEKGPAQIVVTRTDTGITEAVRDMMGSEERITINAPGRYLLEVYTDTEAVGGVFEVK